MSPKCLQKFRFTRNLLVSRQLFVAWISKFWNFFRIFIFFFNLFQTQFFTRAQQVELLILEFCHSSKIIIGFWHFESEVQEKKSETWITFSQFSQRPKMFSQGPNFTICINFGILKSSKSNSIQNIPTEKQIKWSFSCQNSQISNQNGRFLCNDGRFPSEMANF